MDKLEKKHIVEEGSENQKIEEKIIGEEPELILLHITRSVIYANFLKEGLEQAGIPCLIKSEAGLFPRGIGTILSNPLTDIKIYIPKRTSKEGEEIKRMLINNFD